MVGSMFAAISGLKSHQTRMDVIGNNIANVNTWGYKSQSANFMDATYRTLTQGKGGNQENGTGGTNSAQIGYGANVGSITVNYSTGNWSPTGLASDCMIDGPAWFMVSATGKGLKATDDIVLNAADKTGILTEAGAGKVYLSKVGILRQDSQGYLVDDMGSYVLDYKGNLIRGEFTAGTAPAPDKVMQYSSIRISADGKITGIRAQKGPKGEEIGSAYVFKSANGVNANGGITGFGTEDAQIGLAVPANVNGLEKTQGYYLSIGDNTGDVALCAQSVATGQIKSGYLEMSNVDLSNEMATMITTQRGFQANTKIITVTDEMLEQLVNMKR